MMMQQILRNILLITLLWSEWNAFYCLFFTLLTSFSVFTYIEPVVNKDKESKTGDKKHP